MKALLSRSAGGPRSLTLEEVPDLHPGPGQVRIAVRACGVNFPDTLIIQDKYQLRPDRPFSPGAEVSGIVDEIGEGVAEGRLGQRVIGWAGYGGMAEQIVLDAGRTLPMPDSMDFETAAAFLMTYGTSYHALKDRGRLQPGDTLLVLGAAGGVGLAAVEIGRALGARVVAAASSDEKAALAKAHGADEAVVYPTGPFDAEGRKALARMFKLAVGERGADVVYDPVGGDYSEAALRSIAWEGRFLVVGFPAGIASMPLNLALLKGCDIAGVFWGAFVAHSPGRFRSNLTELMDLHQQGRLRPEVSGTYGLADAAEAIEALAERRALGKLVITT